MGISSQSFEKQSLTPLISRRLLFKFSLSCGLVPLLPAVAMAAITDTGTADFLKFSRAITGHAELSESTASAYYSAMLKSDVQFAGQVQKLAALSGATPQDILKAADAAGLKATALAIVAAWYMGSVSNDTNAPTFAYYDALMYAPTRDGLSPPTYCHGRPAWWADDPPALGIAGPSAPSSTPTGTAKPPPQGN